MQKKWNEYQIIDTRQLVNKLPEDTHRQCDDVFKG